MTLRYHVRAPGVQVPSYVCQRARIQWAEPVCQRIPGADIDEAIGRLLIEAITPLTLEVALAVADELRVRSEQVDQLRRQRVERARYEAELAERRYRRVDPDHRLVADALEADWNDKLRALTQAQEEYERLREADGQVINGKQRNEICALATDFPRLWRDPRTPFREKKRMVRLLIEDVTLLKSDTVTAHTRFRGGATETLHLALPRSAAEIRRTDAAVVQRINELLDHHTEGEIAALLNAEGRRSGEGTRLQSGSDSGNPNSL